MPLYFLFLFWVTSCAFTVVAAPSQTLTVIEISEMPDPATTPYEHCLVAVKCYNETESVDQIVLFDLFKKRILFPAAELAKGQTVKAVPIPFDEAKEIQKVMQANDFFDPSLNVFYARGWAPQVAFEANLLEKTHTGSPVNRSSVPTNADLIRRALIAHEQEVTGGLIDDFYFWVHTPEVLKSDFWRDPKISKKGAIGAREAILRFHQNLEKRGIKLILAVVPRSTSIYPGIATNIHYEPTLDGPVNQPVLDLLADLQGEGVTCVDLTSIFLEKRYETHLDRKFPIYRRNDSHWSGAGVKIAAEAIAAELLENKGPLNSSRVEAETITSKYTMPVLNSKKPRDPKPETELIFRVSASGNEALFDPFQRSAEIHLLGDSFVDYGGQGSGAYGLQPHIVRLLGKPVNVFAAGSGGPMISRSQFARAANLDTAEVVIWVFAESFLAPADIWFDVPIGDESITNLEFALESAQSERSSGQFSAMGGLGSGISLEKSGSVLWENVEIGPGQSYPKFTTFAELKSVSGVESKPAEATFTVLVDGVELGAKTLQSDGKSARTPQWTLGLKKLASQTVSLELRASLASETPDAWSLRWTLPQLKNAGFAGKFEPDIVEKPTAVSKAEPPVEKGHSEKSKKSEKSRLLYFGVPVLFITGLGFGIILGIVKKRRQTP